jgi:hypothetical protein
MATWFRRPIISKLSLNMSSILSPFDKLRVREWRQPHGSPLDKLAVMLTMRQTLQ